MLLSVVLFTMSQLSWFVNILKIIEISSRNLESKNREKILNTVDPKSSKFSQFFTKNPPPPSPPYLVVSENNGRFFFSETKKISTDSILSKNFFKCTDTAISIMKRQFAIFAIWQKKNMEATIKLKNFNFESSFDLSCCRSWDSFWITNTNDYTTGFELPTLYSLHLPNPLGSKAICTLNVRSFQLKLFCSHWNLAIAILLQSCISLKLVYAKCKILTSGKKNIPVYQSTKGSLSF